MATRYRQWVENLNWDWGISRQRYFGVPFPIWYCNECGEIVSATASQLPVDPRETDPPDPCPACGCSCFTPDMDVMDTWATSSMTPQIVGRWGDDDELYEMVFPFSLRPQAQEIIRTWAFYTIVKSEYHFHTEPWTEAMISGWGLAPEGTEKLSKSRGGGPVAPMEIIERYSADAARYWAASTGLGKDAVIDEQRIQAGAKLVTKLWNVARFSQRFLLEYDPPGAEIDPSTFTPADRWILARTAELIERSTALWEQYDYATAKSEVELFFWRDLADNYLEMIKKRLYDNNRAEGARHALYHALLATIKLLAPILPYVTDRIYQGLFAPTDGAESIHRSTWPRVEPGWVDDNDALLFGQLLLDIATVVRRYKSDHNLSLGAELATLSLAADPSTIVELRAASLDLASITRAQSIVIGEGLVNGGSELDLGGNRRIKAAVTE
jgi:valyl-tRNA synthetase